MARTLLLKYAETGTLYSAWRWQDVPAQAEAAKLDAQYLEQVQTALTQCLPEPQADESGDAALERALTTGWLAQPQTAFQLGGGLGDSLIPAEIAGALRTERERGTRPRLRIQVSPSTARVPWPLLRIGPEREPLLELADLEFAPPASLAASARPINHRGDSVVAVIDPRVPGASPTSALGSVLGRPQQDDALAALLRHGVRLRPEAKNYLELVRRRDLDERWLREQLADAARFLYVGHATNSENADAGAGAALHLAGAGPHVPVTAAQLVRDAWQFPARCALIACGSASDLRDLEPMGLTLAALSCGAELVTATSWRLPTNAAMALFAGASSDRQPLRELVLAVDLAHDSRDPVTALGDWQRERLLAWDTHGDSGDSPLVWASVVTYTRGGGVARRFDLSGPEPDSQC
ncbi:CHAT domain-containing protein [Gulosibacter hominis]|uniref:CHAT domain-containing protein n=1 Tax=Gulosibacter hominis TaxID=2770504 RepID=UPI00191B066F|nr:CHAT domain-containing protein [Gulosibacter hominis]